MKKEWEQVYNAFGHLDASMIVDFLAAHGIEATSMQESLGSTYGLTVGPLGESRIYVAADQKDAAIALLEAMERGDFELPDEQEPTSSED
jgi:Leu/Phe-tRNA-protein transferase